MKWLRGTFLLNRVDRPGVRLSGGIPIRRPMRCRGAHSRQCSQRMHDSLTRQSLSRVHCLHRSMPFTASRLTHATPREFCYRPLRRVVPCVLAARLGYSVSEVRGRARPLGEVVKRYISLRRVTGSKPRVICACYYRPTELPKTCGCGASARSGPVGGAYPPPGLRDPSE
jgi:hypothetical protein